MRHANILRIVVTTHRQIAAGSNGESLPHGRIRTNLSICYLHICSSEQRYSRQPKHPKARSHQIHLTPPYTYPLPSFPICISSTSPPRPSSGHPVPSNLAPKTSRLRFNPKPLKRYRHLPRHSNTLRGARGGGDGGQRGGMAGVRGEGGMECLNPASTRRISRC